MKRFWLILIGFVLITRVVAHDLYLLPFKFFLKKGHVLTVNMYIGDDFAKEIEKPVTIKDVNLFKWFTHNRTEDLLTAVTDSVKPVISQKKMNFEGLGLLAVNRNYFKITLTPAKFTNYLKEERINNILRMRDTMPAKKEEREKYTRYIKTLVMVGNANGEQYKKVIGQTLEIILLQNPYLQKLGATVQAKVLFRGKPLNNGAVEALSLQSDGKLSKQQIYTNKDGIAPFTISNSGSWMIRITYMLPSNTDDADWESFWASYTFGIK